MSDLISRQAALDALDKHCDVVCQYSKKQRYVMCGACALGGAFDVIEQLPSAQPEQKKGAWEMDVLDGTPGYRPVCIVCSECHAISFAEFPYCPNCGTQML